MFKKLQFIFLLFALLLSLNGCDLSTTKKEQTKTDQNSSSVVRPQLNDSNISVYENVAVGTALLQIDVNDTGDGPILSYTVDDTVNFEILADGTLKNRVSFDYETQREYHLSVYATNDAGDSNISHVNIEIKDKYEVVSKNIPALVVIMNWNDYAENDPTLWHDKFFNLSKNSVNSWFNENTVGEISFTPVSETQGIANDGIVTVSMNKNHPGGGDDYEFRDTEIVNAITSAAVVDSVDFTVLDSNGDGILSAKELQIIFIVAGGEESHGDNSAHSIWAHSWSFPSNSSLKVDGVYVMKYSGDEQTSGTYARFGANHGSHKATIGIICHELGHAAFNLEDYYDDGGGSGLGVYDIMSNGSWAYKLSDDYPGQTPTQYSVFNKIDAGLDVNVTEVVASQEFTMECDGREFVKLLTSKSNEYFLLECRDTAKSNSDISFAGTDSSFGENRLFAMLYHIDTDKDDNTEDGSQTSSHHYKVGLVEKDSSTLMTAKAGIDAEFRDVYTLGDVITKTKLYNDSSTNYAIEIADEDYSARTIKIKITK